MIMLDMWVTAGVEINPSKPSTVSHESNISIVSTSDSFHLVAVHNLWYLYSYQNCGKPFDIMSVVAKLVHCFRFYFCQVLTFMSISIEVELLEWFSWLLCLAMLASSANVWASLCALVRCKIAGKEAIQRTASNPPELLSVSALNLIKLQN